jgi:GNAT superfamily N-acetyltransferase
MTSGPNPGVSRATRLVAVQSPEELGRLSGQPGVGLVAAETLARDAPDAHWVLLTADSAVGGRCSLWWRGPLPYRSHRVGAIGHFAARDSASAQQLLAHACRELADRGSTLAVAPMDGSTWRHYRLVTWRGEAPPFFLEPNHPDWWVRDFEAAGFRPIARFVSTATDDLTRRHPLMDPAAERLDAAGVRIRPLDPVRLEEDLRQIYQVSTVSFRDHLLYAPLTEGEFLALYRPHAALVDPELVLLAEQEDRAVGFVFGLPDLLQARRGVPMDTVVVKTLAILPERQLAGLGHVLLSRLHAVAREHGFTRAIHALMLAGGPSVRVSAKYTRTLVRGYGLFGRELA